jgi:hypothetical protein
MLQDALVWREDLTAAFQEAQQSNRPLFVTFRCLPCKQCAAFDKSVLEGGPAIDQQLKQFVTVRLTDANLLDSSIFPYVGFQDLDLSWWGYFLSPEGRIYGIFGGRDHVSDTSRISVKALKNTMERVLDHHYHPDRATWQVDGQAPALPGKNMGPSSLPGFDDWKKDRPWFAKQTCIHCHQVSDVLKFPALQNGSFDKTRDFRIWPLPEQLGIEVDRDHGLKVKTIRSRRQVSHQLKVGDELLALGDRKLFGQADLRGVLHRFDRSGSLPIWVKRGGKIGKLTISLKEGWREPLDPSHIYWRKSVSDGPIGPYQGFWPLKGPRAGKGSLSVKPWFGKNTTSSAYKAGLRPHHVVTAINGQSPDLFGRELVAWIKLNHDFGATFSLTVLEKGRKRTITFKAEEH